MKKKVYFLILIGIFVVSIISCNKTSIQTANPATVGPVSAAVLSQIGEMGFSTYNIKAAKGGFIVEGDIFLPASSLGDTTKHLSLAVAKTEQYSTNYLVTSLPRTITVNISSMASLYGSQWTSYLDLVISKYNALGLNLTFERVNSGSADITITGIDDAYEPLGATTGFPSSTGNPYPTITINLYNNNLYGPYLLLHELGHCIGLRHTNYMTGVTCVYNETSTGGSEGAVLIPGTPSAPDADSFMTACQESISGYFNSNDVIALNYLYGAGLNLPNPFYRYRHTSNNRHFLTTNYGELLGGMNGYVYEEIQCQIYSKQLAGTVPLYRLDRLSDADFIYQQSSSPISGYTSDGVCGFVYSTQVAGTIPLYRFYNSTSGHFFTTNYSEGGGFTYEGVAAYVISN